MERMSLSVRTGYCLRLQLWTIVFLVWCDISSWVLVSGAGSVSCCVAAPSPAPVECVTLEVSEGLVSSSTGILLAAFHLHRLPLLSGGQNYHPALQQFLG